MHLERGEVQRLANALGMDTEALTDVLLTLLPSGGTGGGQQE